MHFLWLESSAACGFWLQVDSTETPENPHTFKLQERVISYFIVQNIAFEPARATSLLLIIWATHGMTGEPVLKLSLKRFLIWQTSSSSEFNQPCTVCVCGESAARQGKMFWNAPVWPDMCASLLRHKKYNIILNHTCSKTNWTDDLSVSRIKAAFWNKSKTKA